MLIKIGDHEVGTDYPTYFVADIAANHDGNIEHAQELVRLSKAAGADAAKFQNFSAKKIVSDYGFNNLGEQLSHQKSWKKSVTEVYADASIPFEWTPLLKETCDEVGIDYFSAPYDFEAIDMLEPYVVAYKVGSGDVNWLEALERMASKGKPVMLATGAADIGDVQRAVHAIMAKNRELVLMQCNTNYTGSAENFSFINLNVLKTYASMFPNAVLGLSDHTPGHATVLGAVTLGARVIEKHFTDDRARSGPDHAFSMSPSDWREMVDRTRELEAALGSADKFIADNEKSTAIVQRRCLRAARDIEKGEVMARDMVDVLRPATPGAISPSETKAVIGLHVAEDIPLGKELRWTMLVN